MIAINGQHKFEIKCDCPMCHETVHGESAQAVTELAVERGFQMQIKRVMTLEQRPFWFCRLHAIRYGAFDTEGRRIKESTIPVIRRTKLIKIQSAYAGA